MHGALVLAAMLLGSLSMSDKFAGGGTGGGGGGMPGVVMVSLAGSLPGGMPPAASGKAAEQASRAPSSPEVLPLPSVLSQETSTKGKKVSAPAQPKSQAALKQPAPVRNAESAPKKIEAGIPLKTEKTTKRQPAPVQPPPEAKPMQPPAEKVTAAAPERTMPETSSRKEQHFLKDSSEQVAEEPANARPSTTTPDSARQGAPQPVLDAGLPVHAAPVEGAQDHTTSTAGAGTEGSGAAVATSGVQGDGAGTGSKGVLQQGDGTLQFGSGSGPRFAKRVLPRYPELARRRGHEGTVLLRLYIDASGKAHRVEVVDKAGFGLDEAALEAARRSTYHPARRNGIPVACSVYLPVRFQINSLQAR